MSENSYDLFIEHCKPINEILGDETNNLKQFKKMYEYEL